jgi:hypothetical protein
MSEKRDNRGRFAVGNNSGPGRPRRATQRDYLADAGWPARAVRVRPPHKDWGDCHRAGSALRRWFIEEALPLTGAFADEERAAIQEFDGALSREAAERTVELYA